MPNCRACQADQDWLRQAKSLPKRPEGDDPLRLVDLFAGCGGLSFGLVEAARRLDVSAHVALAVESEPSALAVFKRNIETLDARTDAVESLFDGELGEPLTLNERRLSREVGDVDVLVGGPPCQGNSNLNNKTRRNDPRNRLYARMARAAEVLNPICVLIENVPSVRRDRAQVVEVTRAALSDAGYRSIDTILDATAAGVPQRRRRHVMLACRDPHVDLKLVMTPRSRCRHVRSIGWAIRDLETLQGNTPFDTAAAVSAANRKRIAWLFENQQYDLPNDRRPKCHHSDHTYGSMYGRLRWREPAQTLTTGFGSMGQGRYVHPSRRRTLTPHEAARVQTFPDYFDFEDISRTPLARMIGNAVPPLLNVWIGEQLLPQLVGRNMTQPVDAGAA